MGSGTIPPKDIGWFYNTCENWPIEFLRVVDLGNQTWVLSELIGQHNGKWIGAQPRKYWEEKNMQKKKRVKTFAMERWVFGGEKQIDKTWP